MTTEHKDLDDLKGRFEDGDRPTGDDFARLIDSCHNTRHLTDTTITGTLSVQGGLTVDGNINTRDVAADGAKLDNLDSFVRNNSDSWEETADIQAVTTQLQTVSSALSGGITTVNTTLYTHTDRLDELENEIEDVSTTVADNSASWIVDENVNTLEGLLDVDTTNVEHSDILKYDINEQKWYAAKDLHGEGHQQDAFVDLSDTPVAFTGAGKFVKINENNDSLTFEEHAADDWDSVTTTVKQNSGAWGSHTDISQLENDIGSVSTTVDSNVNAITNIESTVETLENTVNENGQNISQIQTDLESYLTDYTVTQNDVTQHQGALIITESQISDLGAYVTQTDIDGMQNHITEVRNISGNWALLDSNGVLMEDQIPELSITQTYTVQNPEEVTTLNPAEGIQRGDIVIVTSTYDNLIAKTDSPAGTYNSSTKAYSGYSKLARPDAYVTSVNDMYGNVTISSDNIDDTDNTNKWVEQTDIDRWNSSLNTTGGTMTGDLDTTARILSGGVDLKDKFWVKGDNLGSVGNYDIQGEITAQGYATENITGDKVVGITKNVNIGGNILHIVNGIIVGVTDA